eukprot:Colp12_sorted_trinity150504_noHs@3862
MRPALQLHARVAEQTKYTRPETTRHQQHAPHGHRMHSPRPHQSPLKNGDMVGNYAVKQQIGQGGFCYVHKAVHALTADEVAIKVIAKERLDPRAVKQMLHEVHILQQLNEPGRHHHGIIKLHEVLDQDDYLYMIMEYCSGGHVRDYIKNLDSFRRERELRRIFKQIVSAVEFCHSRGIAHRDLKSANMILDGSANVRIIDFGLAVQCWEGQKIHGEFPGTLPYAAPELLKRDAYVPSQVDMWSLGVVLYELAVGSRPFFGPQPRDLVHYITRGTYALPNSLDLGCKRIIRRLLVVDPKRRATVQTIKADPWLSVPSPLPPPTLTEAEVYDLMKEYGIPTEVIKRELKSKTFGRMQGIFSILSARTTTQLRFRSISAQCSLNCSTKSTGSQDAGLESVSEDSSSSALDTTESSSSDSSIAPATAPADIAVANMPASTVSWPLRVEVRQRMQQTQFVKEALQAASYRSAMRL